MYEYGAVVNGKYICYGCLVLGVHEHRCFRDQADEPCECELCREPACEELAAFMEELDG